MTNFLAFIRLLYFKNHDVTFLFFTLRVSASFSLPICYNLCDKGEFTQYTSFVRFCPYFLRICFSVNKYVLFHPHFHEFISALTRLSHIGQKLSEKNFLQSGTAQSCNSGRAFRVGFGPKVDKTSGLNRA